MSPNYWYIHVYFQAIDAAIVTIRDRFNQGNFTIYANLEQVIIMKTTLMNLKRWLSCMEMTSTNQSLKQQLEVFSQMKAAHCTNFVTFKDVHKHLQSLPASQLALISQIVHLVKLVLLMPATNAVSERSASAKCCIKTYLRAYMYDTFCFK